MASSGGGAQVANTEQNIFTISSQGARGWVDPVTENTSQLTGCSSYDTNSEMSCSLQVKQPKKTQSLLWRIRHIKFFGGRGVVIVRNPYKALISYWNHQVSDFLNLNGKMIPTHMCLLNLNPSLSILLRLVPPPEEWRSHGPGPTSQFHGLRF